MKALITVVNRKEAEDVLRVGCDILDLKNPREGSLGANYPWVIREILKIVPKETEVSIAIGDIPNLPGTVSLAILGALQFRPDYIKVGLHGTMTETEAIELIKKAVKTVKEENISSKTVIAGYADYYRVNSINPIHLPDIAYNAGASIVMIDTAIKDGRTLLDLMSLEELAEFVKRCHKKKLKVALAGSLNAVHIDKIAEIGTDILGVRGAVCAKKNRQADLKKELVKKIVLKIKNYSTKLS